MLGVHVLCHEPLPGVQVEGRQGWVVGAFKTALRRQDKRAELAAPDAVKEGFKDHKDCSPHSTGSGRSRHDENSAKVWCESLY